MLHDNTIIIDYLELSNIRKYVKSFFEVYRALSDLQTEYPNFRSWYFTKVLPGILYGNRFIVTKRVGGNLAGLAILKKEDDEKKICTLRVIERYKGIGIGSSLLVDSFAILETERPLITVAKTKLGTFIPIFEKFDFRLYREYPSLYRPDVSEISFNAFLKIENSASNLRSHNKGLKMVWPISRALLRAA